MRLMAGVAVVAVVAVPHRIAGLAVGPVGHRVLIHVGPGGLDTEQDMSQEVLLDFVFN